ncbi:hypothetical protein [Usitatibacter rugosus]|nr:hypothetical protein [Usitatibacter rugosus]
MDRKTAAAAWALVGLAAAGLLVPLVHGYFLADDFVPLVLFHQWEGQGRLGAELAAKLNGGLDAGANHFYRPLSYASLALNYVTSGLAPEAWHALNVALHLASGVLAGLLGVMATGVRGARAVAASAAGAALFLFFAPSVEVVAWISGRFDVTATFFTLLACVLFLRSRHFGDAASWFSLLAGIAAFLCKESAAILPFAILLLALVRTEDDDSAIINRGLDAVRRAAPWLAIAALYLLARYFFFGSPTRVYGGSTPVAAALSIAYWSGLAETLPAWWAAQFRGSGSVTWVVSAMAAHVALILYAAIAPSSERHGRFVLVVLGMIVLLTVALVAPHAGSLPADGLGGRFLYQSSAFYGALAAAGLAVARPALPLAAMTVVLAGVSALSFAETAARWNEASVQMRALVADIARTARETPAADFTLVLAPRAYDDILFVTNAQGALMSPPIHPAALTDRLLVQNYDDVVLLAPKMADGVPATMRAFARLGGKRGEAANLHTVCWNPERKRLVPLALAENLSPAEWAEAIGRALPTVGCTLRPAH